MAQEQVLAKKDTLVWSIYMGGGTDYEGWDLNTTTTAPDGKYKVSTDSMDYRQGSETSRLWDSTYKVTVCDGKINLDTALMAVADLMLACGYWGTFIEAFDYDPSDNTFHLGMGS